MFTRMQLQNFKGWADTGSVRLAPITLFFGTNSSGKTSLLQSILLLKQTAASSDRTRVLHAGDDKSLVDLGTPADFMHGHAISSPLFQSEHQTLRVALRWTLGDQEPLDVPGLARPSEIEFRVTVGFSPDEQPYVVEARYEVGEAEVAMVRGTAQASEYSIQASGVALKRRVGRQWPLPAPVRFYGFPDEAANYFQNADWLRDLPLALEKQLERVQYVGPLRGYPKRSYLWAGERPQNVGTAGELAVPALLAARAEQRKIGRGQGTGRRYTAFEEVVADWLKTMGVIESFRVVAVAKNRKDYEVRVKRTAKSSEVLITDVGFGVSQLLPVLVQCYYSAPRSTVIFEQPEIHLHPRVQSDLADVVLDAVKCCDVQFIIESHSEHFLQRLQRRVAEGAIANDQVALYSCDVDGEKSRIEELSVDEFGNITNWPKDFFGDAMGDAAARTLAAVRRRKRA
jgi:predicted ATPase